MKTTPFLTLIYSLIVILSGFMDYQNTDRYLAIFFEAPIGVIIFLSAIVMIKDKTYTYYISAIFSFFLIIYYGYYFASTTNFFPGLMTAISAYIFVMQFIKIFKNMGME